MNSKTIEDRLTRLECEIRDLKTRVTRVDGAYAFRDKRFKPYQQTSHARQSDREENAKKKGLP
jgi:hypothetical protein